jgi:acetyl-CoA C-acetyltransferase
MKVVITSAKRTPIGTLNGGLSSLSAPKLGSIAIKAVLEDSRIDPSYVDEIIVITAGIGQSPCTQAEYMQALPNKNLTYMFGSGLKAIMKAQQTILSEMRIFLL